MFSKTILIGRLGQNAEAKTAQNNREFAVFDMATQESYKNGDKWENRTEWHRVYAWGNLSKYACNLKKGQLISLEGIIRYREVETKGGDKVQIASIHAFSITRLSKIVAKDDPSDGASE